jgi:hypothetical protein
MNRVLVALAMIVTATLGCLVTSATADEYDGFRFEAEQTTGPRGRAVAGWVHNDLPWRITNVRLRVDFLDGRGTVTETTMGWVLGDVNAGGRGYFYIPVSSPASSVRVTVQSFDKVAREMPEAP